MRYLLILLALILVGCQNIDDKGSHIGCQEAEISKDGSCVIAEEKNVELFGQELEPFVEYKYVEGGFIAMPKQQGSYPGIIMIHEWWGLNDNIKNVADTLASEGYVVLAVDLYNGQVATNSSEAIALRNSVNQEDAINNMKAAVEHLRYVYDSQYVASLGWCYGGGKSAELSMSDARLDATIIYYGQLPQDLEDISKVDSPVLGFFGREDASITPESVEKFKQGLDELEIENEIYIYDGVGHAFANPSGTNFAVNQTKDSWQKTLVFLEENLK